MLKLILAGIRAHRRRLLLAAFATVVGTAFFAGTLVLSDTLRANTERTVIGNAARIDVAVSTANQLDKISPEALDEVAALTGVDSAEGQVTGEITVLDRDGRPNSGQPLGISVTERTEMVSGKKPSGPGEAVVAEPTAENLGLAVGDTVTVLDSRHGGKNEFRITGVMDIAGQGTLALRGGFGFTTDEALRLTGETGFTELYINGADPEQLRAEVADVMDEGPYEVQTGRAYAEELAAGSGIDPVVLGAGLTMFAIVALLVAMFVVFNTFTILVAQRTTELALIRCVGASRKQVFVSVFTESLITGLVASGLGVVLGVGTGFLALLVVNALGANIPTDVFTVTPLTVVLSMFAGVLTTALAAFLPARAATRVSPMAALRIQRETRESGSGWLRISFAATAFTLGVGLAIAGVVSEGKYVPLVFVALGGIVFFLGIVVLGGVLIRVLTPIVGFPFARLFGVPGRLAVANAVRNPRRAATTVLALIIGITLTTGVSVITRSLESSQDVGVGQAIPADYLLNPPGSDGPGIPREVAEELRSRSEVTDVTEVREEAVVIGGMRAMVSTVDGGESPEVVGGTLRGMGAGEMALRPERAAELGVGVGDTLDMEIGTRTVPTTVVALVSSRSVPRMTVSQQWFEDLFPGRGSAGVLVSFSPEHSPERTREIVETATASFPLAKIVSTYDAKERLTETLNQVTMLVSGLLGLALLISLIGIANTMTLSVLERSRESAMLRALGMTKRRLHLMLTTEALIFGVIGGIVGALLGIGFGLAGAHVISESMVLSVPITRVVLIIIGAGVASVAAAYLPARNAAKLSVVRTLAGE